MQNNEIKLPTVRVSTADNSDMDYAITYNNQEVSGAFAMTPSTISCSTIQMSGIDDFYIKFRNTKTKFIADLKAKLPVDERNQISTEIEKYRKLTIEKLRSAMSQIVDEKVVLFSTVVGDDPEKDLFFDAVSDFVAVPEIQNPNTGNTIKIWGFYTDAEYNDNEEDEDYDY